MSVICDILMVNVDIFPIGCFISQGQHPFAEVLCFHYHKYYYFPVWSIQKILNSRDCKLRHKILFFDLVIGPFFVVIIKKSKYLDVLLTIRNSGVCMFQVLCTFEYLSFFPNFVIWCHKSIM